MTVMKRIDPLVAMKIAEYYPNRVMSLSIFDDEKHSFSAAICVFKKGIIGDTLYALEDFSFGTEETAMQALAHNVGEAMDYIKVISN
jgi:hypothetical protein